MIKNSFLKGLPLLMLGFPGVGFSDDSKEEELNFKGSLDIQAQKNLYEDGVSKNLEKLFGRINLQVHKNNEEMEGKMTVRAYPSGFGYEPVIGIEGDGSVQTQKVAKFQILDAWAKTKGSALSFKVGRWFYGDAPAKVFGSYLDITHGSNRVLGRLYGVNALEVSNKVGMFETAIAAITKDESLDEGEFRGVEKIRPNKDLLIMLSYKTNIWNRVRDDNSDHQQSWDVQARYKVNKEVQGFVEVAGKENANGIMEYPVLVGSSLPTLGLLNQLILEVEIVDASSGTRKDNPVLWAVSAVKKLSDNYKAQVIVHSAETPSEVSLVSRLTVGF